METKIDKEYSREEYTKLKDIKDELLDKPLWYEEIFLYNGIKYYAQVKGTGTYVEYGIEERRLHLEEIN